eukprot:m.47519 g.47519  ORF g.47519 m.47519 type:complete len:62 (-) comp12637_c0_seq1:434-619(-)
MKSTTQKQLIKKTLQVVVVVANKCRVHGRYCYCGSDRGRAVKTTVVVVVAAENYHGGRGCT